MFWEIFACVVAAAALWQLHVIAGQHRLIVRAMREHYVSLSNITAQLVTGRQDIRDAIKSLPDRETALADAIREFSEASISEPSRALAKWIATEGQRHTSLLESQQACRERERELLERWREQVDTQNILVKELQAAAHDRECEIIRLRSQASEAKECGGICNQHGAYEGPECPYCAARYNGGHVFIKGRCRCGGTTSDDPVRCPLDNASEQDCSENPMPMCIDVDWSVVAIGTSAEQARSRRELRDRMKTMLDTGYLPIVTVVNKPEVSLQIMGNGQVEWVTTRQKGAGDAE